ncbi:MAG: peptidoglycan DD-metalloendopeptidase family protein [Patescibacteria group bacterium]|jgi:murein DD-endopeptidase MepM/ murein hydrolase activator NlpD
MFKKIFLSVIILFFVFAFNFNAFADLNSQLDAKKNDIQQIDQKIQELQQQIDQKQSEQVTLKNQITIIDTEIDKTKAQIQKTQAEIQRTNLEIEKLRSEIDLKKQEISKQKVVLGEYIRLINEYDQISPIEILFGYNSFSQFLDQLDNLETLENKGQQTLDQVQKIKVEMESNKKDLDSKAKDLANLDDQLAYEKEELDGKRTGKENILAQTEDKEEEFQALLAKAKEEQDAANNEIYAIEQQIRSQQQDDPNQDNWQDVGGAELGWPINPVQGISAYFMDSSYYSFWGLQHYAIDIPAPQGTPMHAPADGYVAKYSDAGLGYSYILLYHGNGLSTVFGHASACYVAEGANVKRGDVIGLSGGAPGSRGAGWMTTGPHLHFEVRINGNPVDPMKYLK